MSVLFEFNDQDREVISAAEQVEPWPDFPEVMVLAFSKAIVDQFAALPDSEKIMDIYSANGPVSIYQRRYKGQMIGFMMANVGAPMCVGVAEEIVALGARKLVYFGSCGVLNGDLVEGHFVVPDRAIRDEGTSYHYAPAGDEIAQSVRSVALTCAAMERTGYPYVVGKTWTTDAFYRETLDKVRRRVESGAIVVEMEVAALLAFAQFRQIPYAHFLYAADDLQSEQWQSRNLSDQGLSSSQRYMELAFEIAISL